MDQVARDRITAVIEQDEGGWVVTDNKDDPGGTTVAGVQLRLLPPNFHPESIAAPAGKEAIIQFYYSAYWLPLSEHVKYDPTDYELSCAINCGFAGFKVIEKQAIDCEEFLREWMRHYIKLVVANPKLLPFLEGWFNRVERYR